MQPHRIEVFVPPPLAPILILLAPDLEREIAAEQARRQNPSLAQIEPGIGFAIAALGPHLGIDERLHFSEGDHPIGKEIKELDLRLWRQLADAVLAGEVEIVAPLAGKLDLAADNERPAEHACFVLVIRAGVVKRNAKLAGERAHIVDLKHVVAAAIAVLFLCTRRRRRYRH